MIKTPIDTDVSTSVTGTLTASPIENASATQTNPKIELTNYYLYTTSIPDNELAGDITGIYDNPEDAIMETFYSTTSGSVRRILMNGNSIAKKYIGQNIGGFFYLQYGVDESSSNNPEVFKRNVSTLEEHYSNCTKTSTSITCIKNAFKAEADIYGQVILQENTYGCDSMICSRNFPA